MWNMETSIIPVVVDVLGLIGSDRHTKGLSGSPCLKRIQKIGLASTAQN